MLHAVTAHDPPELRHCSDFLSGGFVGNVLAVWKMGRINHVCVAVNLRLVENMHRTDQDGFGSSTSSIRTFPVDSGSMKAIHDFACPIRRRSASSLTPVPLSSASTSSIPSTSRQM